jgi:GDP-fucose transporter C1
MLVFKRFFLSDTVIVGTAKAAVQSLLAFQIWGNEATSKGLAAIFLVIFGSGLYTWVQMLPKKTTSQPKK